MIPVAAGFHSEVLNRNPAEKESHGIDDCNSIAYDKTLGYIAYAEPAHAENGIIFLGSLMPEGSDQTLIAQGHVLNGSHATIGKEFVYYSGGGWSKSGFSDLAAWTAYMKDFALKLREPLKVSLEARCAN